MKYYINKKNENDINKKKCDDIYIYILLNYNICKI